MPVQFQKFYYSIVMNFKSGDGSTGVHYDDYSETTRRLFGDQNRSDEAHNEVQDNIQGPHTTLLVLISLSCFYCIQFY